MFVYVYYYLPFGYILTHLPYLAIICVLAVLGYARLCLAMLCYARLCQAVVGCALFVLVCLALFGWCFG